jgi:hypothetical protein
MFLMNAKKIYADKGSAIFFDSRLIHRGSPISKKKFKMSQIQNLESKWDKQLKNLSMSVR